MDRLLTPREAAEIVGVSTDHVRSLIKQGSLVATNVGLGKRVQRWRVSPDELQAFIRQRRNRPEPVRRRRRSDIMEGVPEYV